MGGRFWVVTHVDTHHASRRKGAGVLAHSERNCADMAANVAEGGPRARAMLGQNCDAVALWLLERDGKLIRARRGFIHLTVWPFFALCSEQTERRQSVCRCSRLKHATQIVVLVQVAYRLARFTMSVPSAERTSVLCYNGSACTKASAKPGKPGQPHPIDGCQAKWVCRRSRFEGLREER